MFIVAALAASLTVGAASDSAVRLPAASPDADARVEIEFAKKYAARIPSFSRQTKLACSMCHAGFPQLTPFGRLFKLNGYTLTGLPMISAQKDSASRVELTLSPIAPLSVMALIAATNVSTPTPGTLATTTELPQQLSLFAATALSPHMGIFSQLTYTAQDGTIGIDNLDLRYARHLSVGDYDAIIGCDTEQQPQRAGRLEHVARVELSVQHGERGSVAAAATIVEGALAQSVLGLGVYTLFNNAIYAELSGYVAAPQGVDAAARFHGVEHAQVDIAVLAGRVPARPQRVDVPDARRVRTLERHLSDRRHGPRRTTTPISASTPSSNGRSVPAC